MFPVARFYGCYTGLNFAQNFANAQRIPSFGYDRYAYFSTSPKKRTDHNTGNLYLIATDGYANGGVGGYAKYLFGIARRMTWFAATRLPHPEPDREGKLAMHAMAKVSVLIIALLVATAGYLYYQHSIPLLYRHSEPGDPVKEPTFAIFNPFRDRSPERSAEAFLAALKAGQCDVAMSFLSDRSVERIQEMCERDKEHPLVDWRLRNRSDQFDKVRIYFQVNRSGYDGYKGQSWVTVEKKLTVGKWPTMSVFIEDLVAPKNVACGSSGKKFVN